MNDKILFMKRTKCFYAETLVCIVVFILANIIMWPSNPAFLGVDPHPYWIVVLAMAIRYGRPGALFSSLVCSTVFVGWLAGTFGIWIFIDNPLFLRFPFLFALAGFLIGEVKSGFNVREEMVLQKVQELTAINEQLSRNEEVISEAHRKISEDLALRQDTITILSKIVLRLEGCESIKIYEGILESFEEHLNAAECSIYELNGEELILKLTKGWKENCQRPRILSISHEMMGRSIRERRTISIKEYLSENLTGDIGDMLLVIPVISKLGQIFALASIEKIPFSSFTSRMVHTASVICELAGERLACLSETLPQIDEKIYDKIMTSCADRAEIAAFIHSQPHATAANVALFDKNDKITA